MTGSTRELFLESYSRVRGHSTTHFWPDVLANLDLRPLMDESRFVPQPASGEGSEESETPAGEVYLSQHYCTVPLMVQSVILREISRVALTENCDVYVCTYHIF